MARLGYLQDALIELHRAGMLAEACQVLRQHPGPVPDIPDVILDIADWSRKHGSLEDAIFCLQRAPPTTPALASPRCRAVHAVLPRLCHNPRNRPPSTPPAVTPFGPHLPCVRRSLPALGLSLRRPPAFSDQTLV